MFTKFNTRVSDNPFRAQNLRPETRALQPDPLLQRVHFLPLAHLLAPVLAERVADQDPRAEGSADLLEGGPRRIGAAPVVGDGAEVAQRVLDRRRDVEIFREIIRDLQHRERGRPVALPRERRVLVVRVNDIRPEIPFLDHPVDAQPALESFLGRLVGEIIDQVVAVDARVAPIAQAIREAAPQAEVRQATAVPVGRDIDAVRVVVAIRLHAVGAQPVACAGAEVKSF